MSVMTSEVLKGVRVGEHVSFELDVEGRVVKIIQLAPVPKEEGAPKLGACSTEFDFCQELE